MRHDGFDDASAPRMAVMSKNEKDTDLPRHEPQPGATALLRTDSEGDVTITFSDGSEKLKMNRRDFMRVSGVAAATAAMTSVACRRPQRHIVPYVDRPEEVRIGMTNQYATVSAASPGQPGILVKTRAGRPFKLEGNPKHPVSQGALDARGQASYLDLYDPDRLESAVRPGASAAVSWEEVDAEVAERIAQVRAGGGLRILTGATTGSATQALIDTIVDDLPDARHYSFEPLADDSFSAAAEAGYGQGNVPHYRFDQAQLVVSLGSDFLGTWLSPVEFTKQFSSHRHPDGDMNRLITFEGSISLTGVNADHRFRVRPDQLVYVALALANEIFTHHSPAGIPGGAVQPALTPFSAEAVAERLGGDITAQIIERVAADLAAHAGDSIVIAGGVASATESGIALESAVNLLNAALQNDGATIDRTHAYNTSSGPAQLQELIAEMQAGDVDLLIIDEANPVYATPAALGFAEALENVDYVISTSTRLDETSSRADLIATGCHFLECWGDSSPRTGVYAIQQPVILPLFETRSFGDSLLTWFGSDNANPALAGVLEAPDEPALYQPGDGKPYDTGPFYRFLRNHWRDQIHGQADTLSEFEQFWLAALRDGVFVDENQTIDAPRFNHRATVALFPTELPEASTVALGDLGDKILHLFSSIPMGDGRQANNGHLQELPDPITRHTWGSYAMVGFRTAKAANLEQGQLLAIETPAGDTLNFPVLIMPGMHEDVIAIPLGYGRTHVGTVGDDVGENAFQLAQISESGVLLSGLTAGIRATSTVDDVSVIKGAGVIDIDRHRIMATASLDEYRQDQEAGVYHTPTTENLWPDHDFGDLKWGMAIDMTKCTGCSACVIACQEENNIPVVGRQGILEGREMHWLRIDRYYELPEEALAERTLFNDPMYDSNPQIAFGEHLDQPRVLFQPMLCQHCDRAPCETVCPVLATMQSNDGLNQMSYQACVGTRYCANNCPYKVRRYNWFNYTENRADSFFARLYPELKEHARLNVEGPLTLGFNPDVTVRTRGVMEKCTFCVQRIRRAKWEIMKDGRRTFRDGEVVTACQQSCPADAITFGNMLDEEHVVTQQHHEKRAMKALSDLNTQPAIAYLSSIWNTDEELA